MQERHWPWTEAIGLVVVLAIGLVAYLVAQSPGQESAATESVSAGSAITGGPAGQTVLERPDPLAEAAGSAAANSESGRKRHALPKPQRGGLLFPQKRQSEQCVASSPSTLRVVTFNIHSGWNQSRTQMMLPQIAAAMKAMQADVFLLQEVDQNRAWNGRVDEPGYLSDALGMYYSFGTNVLRPGNSRYGTAILSRFPIVETTNTHLPNAAGHQQRGLLRAVIEPVPGTQVSLYSTHLETSEDMREVQARAIAGILAKDPNPAIVGGDMNARPTSPPMATLRTVLTDTWTEVGAGAGLTHPAPSPRSRIDYLLHRGAVEPVGMAVGRAAVSDHRPVGAVYDIAPDQPDQVCIPVLR